jgi:branched-chain amino acid transport system ATP-binding protein
LLEVTGLRAGYGHGPDVVHEVSLTVADGEIVALIGLNGAGKSTTVRSIAGLLPVRSGHIVFGGDELGGLSTDERARRGVMLVPEGRELCGTMSVQENLALGTVPLPTRARRRLSAENGELVYGLFPILADKRKDPAGSLSGGQQQMVAVGRALMGSPKLLILDEPSLGLAPLLVREIFEAIKGLNKLGLSVLLVEQNAAIAIAYSNRAYALELGEMAETDAAEARASFLNAATGDRVSTSGDTRSLDLPSYARMDREGRRGLARQAARL